MVLIALWQAVGLYDGLVGVYDVRKAEDKRVLESTFTSGKHSDAVWEVVWVDKGNTHTHTHTHTHTRRTHTLGAGQCDYRSSSEDPGRLVAYIHAAITVSSSKLHRMVP